MNTQDQILTVLRLALSLLGALMVFDADIIALLNSVLEQALGAVFTIISIVGLIVDKINATKAGAKSNSGVIARLLLVG